MKIISRIYNKTVLAATVALGALATSCTDYLTIIPADVVVEENFWQTKDQVNGVLATSYLKLLSRDAVTKAIIWGELRSDNMTYNPNYNTDIKNIIEANIIDENGYCNWSIFYEAINYANLVLESAADVVDRDPDFSEGDLQVVQGEMLALRALCHFYLVRTFRDIPLALKSAKNDAEIPEYVQVHPLEALDLIMADLDRAENMVMISGAFSSPQQNYGRITRNAVLAIKADVNLWRAAFSTYYAGTEYKLVHTEGNPTVSVKDANQYYDACIENCTQVLAYMDEKIEKKDTENPYNLILNRGLASALKESRKSTAYDEIFGSKNSSESIFELQVQGDNIKNEQFNGAYRVYGSEGTPGLVVVPQNFVTSHYQVDDLRAYSYFTEISPEHFEEGAKPSENSICVAKYASKESPATGFRSSGEWDANWIVYRRTDVMLMKAEALVRRAATNNNDVIAAFNIVNAINTRSRMNSKDITNPLKVESYTSGKESIVELVKEERLRELSYEGKRWYDLVRQALIDKETKNIKFVADRLGSIAPVVKIKMNSIDALFLPIYVEELRYNTNLKQNPAYDKKDDTSIDMN